MRDSAAEAVKSPLRLKEDALLSLMERYEAARERTLRIFTEEGAAEVSWTRGRRPCQTLSSPRSPSRRPAADETDVNPRPAGRVPTIPS